MLEIEKYLITNPDLVGDDKYVSDGSIAVVKKFLNNKPLCAYQNWEYDYSILEYVDYDKGEYFELPNQIELFPNGKMVFKYSEKWGFDYHFVKLFENSFCYCEYYVSNVRFDRNTYPCLKVFNDDEEFLGVIMSILLKE